VKYIYSTAGDWVALLDDDEKYLYDTRGECIAWLDGKEVYTLDGMYAGMLSQDGRIVRERVRRQRPLRPVPPIPPRIKTRARAPLPPYFAELPWNQVDVFDKDPDVFRYVSELRPDWED
jgi:hypothetical protein